MRDRTAARLLDEVFDWLRFVDRTFSPFVPDSDVARIARGTLGEQDARPLVREVLARCEALRVATGGYFDVHASGRLDPSGFVKGWAIDRAAELLERAGARSFCLNAGGDVLVRGGVAQPWRVGIRHPRRPDRLACVVELTDGAVATSGAYERGSHIVDPRTGRPPTGVQSVTVVGRELATADAYATAAFAMGKSGAAWTASLAGHDAMVILGGDRVLSTPGFLERCPGGSPAASVRRSPLAARPAAPPYSGPRPRSLGAGARRRGPAPPVRPR